MTSASNWFSTEIQQMMFGFGDSKRPLLETATLIEGIVHQQIVTMIHRASEIANIRGEKAIGVEDIIFLLRKDKVKLKRFLRYYEFRDLRQTVKTLSMPSEEAAADTQDVLSVNGEKRTMSRSRMICHEFLSSIDQTGELMSLMDDKEVDVVKHERMVRAEMRAQGLDPQSYIDFCQARQANFGRRYNKSQRFRDWLQIGVGTDTMLTAAAVEIFSYLAYETVAQIVDLALLVKQDSRAVSSDPLSRGGPALCVNYADIYNSSSLFKQDPNTTSQGTAGEQTTGISMTSPATSATASSRICGKKKRKRGGGATSMEYSWDTSILPADIREAMRRYYTDISPFSSQQKINHQCSPWHKYLSA